MGRTKERMKECGENIFSTGVNGIRERERKREKTRLREYL